MARRRKGRLINGVVLLNKDVGGSSNQVLQKVRWLFQAQKAGHTGALDPLASGMLPICLGEATKFSQFLLDADKTYEVIAKLGERTSTSDADGDIISSRAINSTPDQVKQAANSFVGKTKQVPSMYSALKYQGKPLYFYARQGIEVPRQARDIEVYSLEVLNIDFPFVSMRIHCSKGTYIRTIVDDLGEKLGCGAYVTKLHRTQVARYPSDKMLTLYELEKMRETEGLESLDSQLLSMDTPASQLRSVFISSFLVERFQHGQAFDKQHVEGQCELNHFDLLRVYDVKNLFLGVGELREDELIHPKRLVVHE